jgi:NAD(P)-dependent dehydrogenase (short-subunit alcohol dehydrogenase family)
LNTNRLDKKIALITGSAQGIGEAIANIFSKEGAIVIVSDIQDSKGEDVAKKIGNNSLYIHLDVREEKDWERVISTIIQKYKKLDILVNNAGIIGIQKEFGPQDPENASLESWRSVHATNSDGTFLGCKYAIKAMKNSSSASIINISSRSGIVGIPAAAAYAASKAAIRNHTKSVALYCAQKGYSIRCNSIHPAAILTPMWDPILGEGNEKEKNIKIIEKDIPMKKMGTAEDVAFAALYLASDESKYITGVEINVDGGILAGAAASPNSQK